MNIQRFNQLFPQLIPNIGTIVVVAFMLFAYNAWAAPASQGSMPGVITYQGTLTDSGGQPVTGNVKLTFKLYDVPTGGTALWTETHSGVSVEEGLFRVGLGSLTPIPASVWDNAPLYLGIQVGSEAEMDPRELVGAVPFALNVPDGTETGFWYTKGTSDATTDSPNPVLMPEMSLTIETIGKPIEIQFDTGFRLDGPAGIGEDDYAGFGLYVDDVLVSKHAQAVDSFGQSTSVQLMWIADNLPAGTHTIEVKWWANLSTQAYVRSEAATNDWEQRVLTVREHCR